MLERARVEAPFSFRRLWAVVRDNRGFRRLYAANAVSQPGDWFKVVALFALLVELTGAGQAVALALLPLVFWISVQPAFSATDRVTDGSAPE